MENIAIRTEKEQQTVWLIIWAICFVLQVAFWAILILFVPATDKEARAARLVFWICLAVTVVIMLLIKIWIPMFYRSLEYEVCGDCVKMKNGVIWKRRVTVPFTKITNVDITQGPLQRIYNIGSIHIQTAGAGGAQGARAEVVFSGLRDLEGVKDAVMERVKGYVSSRPREVKEEGAAASDSEILGRMLEELGAIREILEKRQV